MSEITSYGHIDDEGKMSIYSREVFMQRAADYLSGKSIEIVVRERLYFFSEKMRGYYFGVVIPEIRKAYMSIGVLKTLHDTDYEMRDKFLYYEIIDEETGEYEKHLHTLRKGETQVSGRMMREYVDMCIMFAIQNLDWAIPYPSEEFTDDDKTEHQSRIERIKTKIND